MAYILIDGYNLIGIAHDNLEKVRNDLIEKLKKYSDIKKHHVTLVFDGWKSGQKDQTEIKTRALTVIYSRLGEIADLVIKRLVKSSTFPWIVVSSDREISEYAENHDHAAVSSAEFEEKLYLALRNPVDDSVNTGLIEGSDSFKDNDDEIDSVPTRSRGNPRQLSKRQKNKFQALRKL
ncbi:MAG: NYN domain-containing protein [Nitrospirae bacterium]|nr:NYN domain-containing protein [Nitrospirota bacterium]